MKWATNKISYALVAATMLLSACATTEALINKPGVELTGVELSKVSFSQQTFLLSFSVSNPNSFALPVESIRYRILFDAEKFAGGETPASFSIPANGKGTFTLNVETDFLSSVSQISSLVSGGVPDHVEYELQGSLTVDIPLVRPLAFTNSGVIPIDNDPF